MNTPLFSIITINWNNAQGLRKTLLGTFAQTCSDYEQIVIDGASTDGSQDVIREFADRIAVAISEPDTGIYNAMNKGVRTAHGKYLIFMNSGDRLWNPFVLEAFEQTARNDNFDILYGDYMLDDTHGGVRHITQPRELSPFLFNPPVSWGICHQSLFYRNELVAKLESYDESFKIAADWKFTLRALVEHKATQCHLPVPVAFYDFSGISSDLSNQKKSTKEAIRACHEVIPPEILSKMREIAKDEDIRKKKEARKHRPSFKDCVIDITWMTAKKIVMSYLKWKDSSKSAQKIGIEA